MGDDGTLVAVLRLCERQEMVSLWMEDDSGGHRWEIEPDEGTPRPAQLPLLDNPAGWHVEESSLASPVPGEVYVVGFAGLFGPDVEPVKFRTTGVESLRAGEVWSFGSDVAGEARAMTVEEFEDRAGDECRAFEREAADHGDS
jgi:hypothetical protein